MQLQIQQKDVQLRAANNEKETLISEMESKVGPGEGGRGGGDGCSEKTWRGAPVCIRPIPSLSALPFFLPFPI